MDWFRNKVKGYLNIETAAEKLYRVQIGAFKNRQNAENYLAEAKTKGFDGFVVEVVK